MQRVAESLPVLVVDDDERIRQLCRDILEYSEIQVDTAVNGAEALAKIRQRTYGAMILDLMMPVVNGFEVLQEIRATHPDMLARTIVATAASEETLRHFSDQAKIAGLIRKPFDIQALRELVDRCLAVARQQIVPRARAD
jgi:DNA-binding response OmpR family regulator